MKFDNCEIQLIRNLYQSNFCLLLTEDKLISSNCVEQVQYYYFFDNFEIYCDFTFNPKYSGKYHSKFWLELIKQNAQQTYKKFINF